MSNPRFNDKEDKDSLTYCEKMLLFKQAVAGELCRPSYFTGFSRSNGGASHMGGYFKCKGASEEALAQAEECISRLKRSPR